MDRSGGRNESCITVEEDDLIHSLWHIVIHKGEVRRLIGLVVGAGQGDGGEEVEGELAVGLGVLKLLALGGRLCGMSVLAFVLQSPWLFSCDRYEF